MDRSVVRRTLLGLLCLPLGVLLVVAFPVLLGSLPTALCLNRLWHWNELKLRERLLMFTGALLGPLIVVVPFEGTQKIPEPGLYVSCLVVGLLLAGMMIGARSRNAVPPSVS
jgi:uncharacterized membrane protein YdcZ (DUF606 family)